MTYFMAKKSKKTIGMKNHGLDSMIQYAFKCFKTDILILMKYL